jgi:hypothetical protein
MFHDSSALRSLLRGFVEALISNRLLFEPDHIPNRPIFMNVTFGDIGGFEECSVLDVRDEGINIRSGVPLSVVTLQPSWLGKFEKSWVSVSQPSLCVKLVRS